MQFQLITPEKIFFSGDAQLVTIPGEMGQFGVMDGHAPLVSNLRAGIVTISQKNGDVTQTVVLSGIAEVTQERCVVLAQYAKDCTGITLASAQSDRNSAQQLVDAAVTEDEKKSAAHALAVADALLASL